MHVPLIFPTLRSFAYDGLEPGSIRLLLIKARAADAANSDQVISCQLLHTPLPDSEECPVLYEALSYTWGAERATLPIIIDGCSFYVRPNLHDALKTLRQPHSDRMLWVDAICINQIDARERDDQVSRMGTIYSCAATVMIYLGGSGDRDIDCGLGLAYLRNMVDFSTRMDEAMNATMAAEADVWIELRPQREQQAERARVLAERYEFMFEREDPSQFIIFIHIALSRPWWRRVWTLQEIVLAQKPVLFCGDQALPWSCFVDFRRHMAMTPVRNVLYAQIGKLPMGTDAARQLVMDLVMASTAPITEIEGLREASKPNSKTRSPSLSSALLTALRYRAATDGRDMIYGILGMAGADRIRIVPDYANATIRSVYTTAFRRIISEDGNLRCLTWAQLQEPGSRNRTLPSWVPDLTAMGSSESRRTIGVGPIGLNNAVCTVAGSRITRIYNAPGNHGCCPNISFSGSDGSNLVVEGRSFDKIVAISEQSSPYGTEDVREDGSNTLESVLQQWQAMARRQPERYPTGIHIEKAFWMTVAVGQKIVGYHPGFSRMDCQRPEDFRLEEIDQKIPPQTPEDQEGLVKALKEHNIGLRFFVTEKAYFGVGQRAMDVGDEVSVLMEAEVPFIMRRTQCGTHHLVGEW